MFFESVNSSTNFYNIHLFETLKHRLLKKEIEITHTHIKFHIKSTNNHSNSTSKFKLVTSSTLSRSLFVSFRFANVSTICLRQWHSMNSLQRLMNLFQWNFINEFVSTTSKTHAFDFLHLYEFKKRWIYYIQRYENKWHRTQFIKKCSAFSSEILS